MRRAIELCVRSAACAVLLALGGTAVAQQLIYVDDDGPADFNTIQAAIDDAKDGDVVLVAPGTYTGDGNRDIDFKGKAITVKSESGAQTCIIDCNATQDEPHRGFHFDSAEGRDSVLEGLTITNGFTGTGGAICCDGSSPTIRTCTISANSAHLGGSGGRGGGIYCAYSDAILSACRIVRNRALPGTMQAARGLGGGIYCHEGSPSILHCEISDNQDTVSRTGAIHCSKAKARIANCEIAANRGSGLCISNAQVKVSACVLAGNGSDGVHCMDDGHAAIDNCVISSNQGAGIASLHGDVAVTHCLIVGNRGVGTSGGGIYCRWSKLVTLNNSTIADNSSWRSGGIYCEGISCSITNCIVSNNRPLENQIWVQWSIWGTAPYACTLSYSNIQRGQAAVYLGPKCTVNWALGNIDSDPCFVRPSYCDPNGTPRDGGDDFWVHGDYHLKSQAGRWDTDSKTWVKDDVTSPCIDAGDPMSPIGHEPFPNGGIINIGAYGGTAEASKSYFGRPVCETIVAGDINGDCKVDFTDFALMAAHWLEEN